MELQYVTNRSAEKGIRAQNSKVKGTKVKTTKKPRKTHYGVFEDL